MIEPPDLHPGTLPFLTKGEKVLVGISGGRDSVALLAMLAALPGCHPVACHVHHRIRRESADRDALFVEELAARLNVPFKGFNVDVPLMAGERKLSLEEAARAARQDCFLKAAREGLGSVVALAQHRDDQTETVIMNLCRGGAGLRGMKPVACWANGLTVLRPFLNCSRAEITRFLLASNLRWVEDETNLETDYTRNAVRHEIIPKLNQIMKREISIPVNRAAMLAGEESAALAQAIDLLDILDPQGRLFLPKVNQLPEELKKAVVFHYLKKAGVPALTEDCVRRVLDILPIHAPARTSLPGNWIACRKEKRLFVVRKK